MSKKFDVAIGIQGAGSREELHLQQVRLLPTDNSEIESRRSVDLVRKFHFKHADVSIKAVPVIAANMFGVGTIKMAEVFAGEKMLVALEKHLDREGNRFDVEPIKKFLVEHEGQTAIPTVGFTEADGRILKIIFEAAGKNKPSSIIIDVPNGHMQKMLKTIEDYRREYPDTVIMAGNVATGSMARKIIKAGADVVKVGIGPGSACTTKSIAATHRPQFSAIRDCAHAVHDIGGYVIADGGVKTAGDVSIAMAAGGDFVMIGGAFAAHDESGEPIYIDDRGQKWMEFMGSSSAEYMNRTAGEVAHYRAPEGELQWIPYKGSIKEPGAIMHEILGGMRSAFSYAGSDSIKDFARKARHSYNDEKGGLRLVKATVDSSGPKGSPSKIVAGEKNPLTEKQPRPELIVL